jgi:hypothetical protein
MKQLRRNGSNQNRQWVKGWQGLLRYFTQGLLVWAVLGYAVNVQAATHQYQIAVDPDFEHVDVRAQCVSAPGDLIARNDKTSKLDNLQSCEGERLRTRRGSIQVPTGVARRSL